MPVAVHEFMHPEDLAAQEQLKSIPLFDQCVKMFLKMGIEEFFYIQNMAQKIRLGPDQLPAIYNYIPPICETLGIDTPEVYLEMNPSPNAYALGDTRLSVTVTSGLVEGMEAGELQAVLAHECGHIACRHTLYRTIAMMLVWVGPKVFGPLAALSMPIQLGLQYWSRRSELSVDRAAAVVMKGARPVVDTMIRLAGGPKSITSMVNVDVYLKQAEAYDKTRESQWDKILQSFVTMNQTHPFQAVRCREIIRWCETEHFQRMMEGLAGDEAPRCPGCRKLRQAAWKFCRHCGASLPESDARLEKKEGAHGSAVV